jgi:hypothetical protein
MLGVKSGFWKLHWMPWLNKNGRYYKLEKERKQKEKNKGKKSKIITSWIYNPFFFFFRKDTLKIQRHRCIQKVYQANKSLCFKQAQHLVIILDRLIKSSFFLIKSGMPCIITVCFEDIRC